MGKNKRILTVLLTFTLSFLFSGYMAFAAEQVGGGWYINAEGVRVTYSWWVDEDGGKWTEWDKGGVKQKPLDGLVVPGKPLGKSTQPINYEQLVHSFDIEIRAVGDKHLSVNTDEDVSISIVNLAGNTVKQLYVEGNSNTIISLEDLVTDGVYGIVLVNNAGMAHRKTFILNDYQILFDR